MRTVAYHWLKTYRLHIIIWCLYILYETVLIGFVFKVFGHPLTYTAHYAAAILLFYFHADRSLPWIFKDRFNAIWKAPLVIPLELGAFIMINYGLDMILIRAGFLKHEGQFRLELTYQLKTLYRGILFAGFSTGYYFLKRYHMERERSNELEKQRLQEIIQRQRFEHQLAKAENDFLKAQINPHFLFNTLDFIYHSILGVSPAAANTIIALADMMRFALDADKADGQVRLGDELEQLENLFYLNQIRKDLTCSVKVLIGPGLSDLKIIPLILLTLGENMIKHGDLTDPSKPAIIEVQRLDQWLIIRASNPFETKSGTAHPGGNGLKNVNQRLQFAYGTKATFACTPDDQGIFTIEIRIATDALTGSLDILKTSSDTGTALLHGNADYPQITG